MSVVKKLASRRKRRAMRVRKKVKTSGLPRVSIFRSVKHMHVQLIDDVAQTTVVSVSTLAADAQGTKAEQAKAIGVELAKKALEKGINTVSFDRGSFLYHGRVKAVAEGLREGGLKV